MRDTLDYSGPEQASHKSLIAGAWAGRFLKSLTSDRSMGMTIKAYLVRQDSAGIC